jgi:peptide/nickel transport system substrate-binding protein
MRSMPSSATPSVPIPTSTAPALAPVRGAGTLTPTRTLARVAGELHIAVRENIRSLNPYAAENDSEAFVVSLLYDTLLEQTLQGDLAPNLAQRWEVAPDGISLSFWLNSSAQWHDGQPVTAQDVVFSFELVRRHQLPGLAHIVSWVDRVEAVNPSEVKFTLLAPRADALRLLATQLCIVPATRWQDVDDPANYANLEAPIGSGPFLFLKLVEEEQLVLRNAASHHVFAPSVDTLVVEILRNEDRALEALREGQLDALGWDANPEAVRRVQDDPAESPGVRWLEAPGERTEVLLFNLRRAPYDDAALRRALVQAIDTYTILQEVAAGFGDAAVGKLFPPASPWRSAGLAPIPFAALQAVKDLDVAGFADRDGDGSREQPDGGALSVAITCSDLPVAQGIAERVAANWGAVGISAQAQPIAQDMMVPTLISATFEVVLTEVSLAEPEMAYFYFHSSRGVLNHNGVSGLNYGGYANPELDELARLAQKELDPGTRQVLLDGLQEILATDLPVIPLYHPRVLSLYRDDHFSGWSVLPGRGILSRAVIAGLTASRE